MHTPVHWGSYEPGALEITMALLLHQSRPHSWHRAPSQGDGGVDVVAALPDGRFDVYQIKGFTGRLSTAGRKRQIKKSLEAVIADPRLPGKVRGWYLVLPLDFTSGEEAWFNRITESAPFEETGWLGESFWHLEASRYPYVVDYYLLNRREEVQRTTRALLDLASGELNREVTAIDVGGRLRELCELADATSPFYRFEYHLTQEMPPLEGRGGALLSHTQGPDGGPFETVDVIARFPQATEFEPVTARVEFTVESPDGDDPEFDELVRDWFEYGSELAIPQGRLKFTVSAPGGLGVEDAVGGGWIGTPAVPVGMTVRARLVTSDGAFVELPMLVSSASNGILGGREFHLLDSEKLVSMRFRIAADRSTGEFFVSIPDTDLAGRPVARLQPTISFLGALRDGATIQVLPEMGNHVLLGCPLNESIEPLDDELVALVELLAGLQPHVAQPIRFPAELGEDEFHDLRRAAALIEDGEYAGKWGVLKINFTEGVGAYALERFHEPQHVVMTGRYEVTFDTQVLDFGPSFVVFYSAVVDAVAEDHLTGRLVPSGDERFVRRLGKLGTLSSRGQRTIRQECRVVHAHRPLEPTAWHASSWVTITAN